MLSKWKKAKAKEYARELALDGMIWGNELEEYIKADEAFGIMQLKKSGEREAFMDEILDWVQMLYDRVVVIYDYQMKTSKIFVLMEDAAKELEVNTANIYSSISKDAPIRGRYFAGRYKPKIKEINQGLRMLDKTIRRGRIN